MHSPRYLLTYLLACVPEGGASALLAVGRLREDRLLLPWAVHRHVRHLPLGTIARPHRPHQTILGLPAVPGSGSGLGLGLGSGSGLGFWFWFWFGLGFGFGLGLGSGSGSGLGEAQACT
eukprot:scaffold90553_cov57-Phaeocystis_antarctica.AAC.1